MVGTKNIVGSGNIAGSDITVQVPWRNTNAKAWCNSTFFNSLPANIRGVFKDFTVVTRDNYNTDTGKLQLAAVCEITGQDNQDSIKGLPQIEYYKTAANRKKQYGGENHAYLTRSPYLLADKYNGFLDINANGDRPSMYSMLPNSSTGYFAPFGVI